MKSIVLSANSSWYLYNFRKSTILKLLSDEYIVVCLASDSEYKKNLEELGVIFNKFYLDSIGVNPFKDLFSIYSLLRILKKISPSIVLSFTPKVTIYSSIASRILRIPSIINVSGLGMGFVNKGFKGIIYRSLYWAASKATSFIFFQNKSDMQFFVSEFNYPVDLCKKLPGSGVNLDEFKFSPLARKRILRFGFFGRLIEEKGIRIFVDSAKKLTKTKSAEFVVAGPLDKFRSNAISQKELDEWEEKGYIKYLGNLSDVKDAMIECDCIVLPSYYPEGTPRCLIEAAALGRPIITTNNPGCSDVVGKTNGILIGEDYSHNLTMAFKDIVLLSFNDLEEMSKASRLHATLYFDENIVLEEYEKAILEFIL